MNAKDCECTFFEPDESNPHPSPYSFKIPFHIILLSLPRTPRLSLPFRFCETIASFLTYRPNSISSGEQIMGLLLM